MDNCEGQLPTFQHYHDYKNLFSIFKKENSIDTV